MEFTNKDGIKLVDKVISTIQENRDYLSQIDGEAGDGDHGINMNKGMTFTQEELERLIPLAEQMWIDWRGKLPDDYVSPLK